MFNLILQVLRAVDDVGSIIDARYSKINKHLSLTEVENTEVKEIIDINDQENEEKKI